jgi:general secretion pathway protein C
VAVGAGTWALGLFAPAGNTPSRENTIEPVNAPSRVTTVDPNRSDQTRSTSAYLPPAAPMAAPASTGDFKLVGVVAPRESVAGSQWVALIAVNGEPARAFSIGAMVDGDIVLRAVSARGAILGPREGSVAMALEVQPAPATGMTQLPTAASGLESANVSPSGGSKYLPVPPPNVNEPEISAEQPDPGRWIPPVRP